MPLDTLFPHTSTLVVPRPIQQGRSKKKLRTVIEHDGRVWIAYYQGRGNRFFGASKQEAQNNLQAGAA